MASRKIDLENPLSEEDYAKLKALAARVASAKMHLQRLRSCGAECRGQEALAQAMGDRIARLCETFGPERR